ncbi:MAG: PilN domain-containing protein [bacterium]|nr:PilN domain-containing protein [bacterium]
MIEINLLPEEERKRKKSEGGIPKLGFKIPTNLGFFVSIGVAVFLFILIFIIHFSQIGQINKLKKKISEKENELKKLQEEVTKVEKMKEKENEINTKIETIKNLISGKFAYAQLLDKINQLLPEYVWLEELTVKDNRLILKGKTFSNLMITDLLTNMKKEKEYFDNFVLKDIVNKPEGGYDIISFEINCTYKK